MTNAKTEITTIRPAIFSYDTADHLVRLDGRPCDDLLAVQAIEACAGGAPMGPKLAAHMRETYPGAILYVDLERVGEIFPASH
jgi:hypothetical protein